MQCCGTAEFIELFRSTQWDPFCSAIAWSCAWVLDDLRLRERDADWSRPLRPDSGSPRPAVVKQHTCSQLFHPVGRQRCRGKHGRRWKESSEQVMRTVETDILVVGAGPAGLAASAFLGKLGTRAITIARHPGTAPQPRASITNQRTTEIMRDLGIEDRVRAVGTPLKTVGNNVLAISFTGPEILRYPSYGTGTRIADFAASSPCEGYIAPQHLVEPELLRAATKFGADIRFSHELMAYRTVRRRRAGAHPCA